MEIYSATLPNPFSSVKVFTAIEKFVTTERYDLFFRGKSHVKKIIFVLYAKSEKLMVDCKKNLINYVPVTVIKTIAKQIFKY